MTYRGAAWTSIAVDIARAEPGETEIEWLPAIPLTADFGITGPTDLPCLPLRLHIAQKLHGMTLPPRPGRQNDRFRDLVDLLLMEELISDYGGLRHACETVFRSRPRTTGLRRLLFHRTGSIRSHVSRRIWACPSRMPPPEWSGSRRSSTAFSRRGVGHLMPDVGEIERCTQRRIVALFREQLGYAYLGPWTERAGNRTAVAAGART